MTVTQLTRSCKCCLDPITDSDPDSLCANCRPVPDPRCTCCNGTGWFYDHCLSGWGPGAFQPCSCTAAQRAAIEQRAKERRNKNQQKGETK